MEAWLAEGKTIWVLCQIGISILVAIKIGIGWTILLEIVAIFLIGGAVEVWKPEEPTRYRTMDFYAKEFEGMMRSKRYTKAQLNTKAYEILAKYMEHHLIEDPNAYEG